MKTKLMAFILAAGLGIAAITAQAKAAEGKESENSCAHSMIVKFTSIENAVNIDGTRHYVEYKITYICVDCEIEVVDYEGGYEPHDYEQIYFDNGKIMSYCTVCDDRYFW